MCVCVCVCVCVCMRVRMFVYVCICVSASMFACAVNPIQPELASLVVSPLASFFFDKMVESCPTAGCLYNPTTMRNAIDWNNCYVTSFGATDVSKSSVAWSAKVKIH